MQAELEKIIQSKKERTEGEGIGEISHRLSLIPDEMPKTQDEVKVEVKKKKERTTKDWMRRGRSHHPSLLPLETHNNYTE